MGRSWQDRVDAARQNLIDQRDRLDLWERELAKLATKVTTEDEQEKVITGLNEATLRIREQIDVLESLGV
ncbi:hypothetical protein GGR90_000741 [Sphingopyxis italica]|uniref:Uncharacterized protein n=1 Tax=Sphingopyxis italica TaxID=1129133 RepID=A0A7X5XPI7_9SPHN|nr:hypothetical protein [Sphingopyxis italica]NJB88589.1 hypothetical protein [Sphingopyxis italica]